MEMMVTKSRPAGGTQRRPFVMGVLGAVAGAIALTWAGLGNPAAAAEPSANDKLCLTCHSMPGLEKTLADGEKLPLQIPADSFAHSVHSGLGCTGCHTDISLPSHPGAGIPIQSSRAFSIKMMQICANCHTNEYQQWTTSVHAALVKEGNPVAPVCTNCHSQHAVTKGVAEAFNTVPCKTCHAAIFTAYSGSVHGMLRGGGLTQAPLCFSCHGAHAVHVPSEIQGLKDVCLGCHKDAVQSHRTWLPNVDLHFDVVSCPACHVPHAQRRVDLVLFNNTTQKATSEPRGIPEFQGPDGSPTTGPAGLDPQTLFTLLQSLNKPGVVDKTVIKGRLEVSTAVQAHQIAPSSAAVSDCATCHQAGSNAFDSVVVSVAGPAGIPIVYGANKDVLRSAFSIASIGGFYAIGATRITILDAIVVLALLAGFGVPIVHGTLRILVRYLMNNTHHK
jgi:hypothetical protein